MMPCPILAQRSERVGRSMTKPMVRRDAAEPCDVDSGVFEPSSDNSDAPAAAELLLEEGLACLDKDAFYEAFVKMRQAFEKSPDNVKYRRCLVILQRLSSKAFILERLENRCRLDLNGAALQDHVEQARMVHRSIDSLRAETDDTPQSFARAADRLLRCGSDLIAKIGAELEIQRVLIAADEAFRDGDYGGEARWLNRAVNLGWTDADKALNGCQLLLRGRGLLLRQQRREALESLQLIPATDRHYAVARRMIRQTTLEMKEEELIRALDKAWSGLLWEDLRRLAVLANTPDGQPSSKLRALITTTQELVGMHQSFLETKTRRDLAAMALSLSQMQTRAEESRFSALRRWIDGEKRSLMPQIESRFETHCRKATEVWGLWKRKRVSSNEISEWGEDTDYEDVKERFGLLGATYSSCLEIDRLVKAVPERLLKCSLSTTTVRNEIETVCGEALGRAHVLERFDDYAAAIAIYRMLTALPHVEGNECREQARRQLEKLETMLSLIQK